MKSEKFKIKNWLLISAVALVAFIAGGLMINKAKAETNRNYLPIVQKLVDKVGLKEEEVTGVFNEMHQERQQKMQAQIESRLNEAVENGVITAEQKEALFKKQAEWQEKQRQMMEEKRKWVEESGIDFEKLAPYWGGFGKRGFGGHGFGRGFGPGGF